MLKQIVIEIVSKRIMNGGLNPKTNLPFQLSDIPSTEYETEIENFIILSSGILDFPVDTTVNKTPPTL